MTAVAVITAPEPADPERPESWIPLIREAWGSSVRGIIETGRLLAAAKAAVPHGDWSRLIDEMLPFGDRVARRLMQIAAHPAISNRTHESVLPPSYNTLEALARLDAETFGEAVEAGIITPTMERRAAQRLARAGSVDAFRAAPAPADDEDSDEEAQALDSAADLVRRLLRVQVPAKGVGREAAAMIEAVATVARCATEAMFRAEELHGPDRRRAVEARRLAIYMLHTECELSQPEACRPFGLEPSGASYIAKQCEDYRSEPSFERLIERIAATQVALLEDGSFE